MSYIGRDIRTGAFRQLDDISSGFDGSDTTHTMQVNSTNVSVGDVNQILLSLGGVIQKPGTDFTVSGSTLTFTTAPAANTSFFAILLGSDNGGTVTPTDASVTTGKIAADAITSAKIADDAVTGDHIASSGAFAIGAANTASSIAGVTFYVGQSGSIYTADVSGTDNDAENNTAFGSAAMDAITTGDNNTAMGEDALGALTTGAENVAIGYAAGKTMTSSNGCTFVGYQAGETHNYDGSSYVTMVGYQAGDDQTTSAYNTGFGAFNQAASDTETHNTSIGYYAMNGANGGGEQNTALGSYVLSNASQSGDYNVGAGYRALYSCTSGYSNKAFGWGALYSVTEGFRNVGVGHQAGYEITTGDNNICIGYDSGRSSSPSGAITTANNTICLGDDNIANLFCADTSISSSDKRDKTDIKNFTAGLSFIEKMQPVTYKWDKRSWYNKDLSVTPDGSKKATETNVGFLAQDIETLEKEIGFANDKKDMLFVNLSEDDKRYGMKYERLVTVLVNAVKELSAKVKALEEA